MLRCRCCLACILAIRPSHGVSQWKEGKIDKLTHISRFASDDCKLQFLDKQIKDLVVQNEKNEIFLQIALANLRCYDLDRGDEFCLNRLVTCEENLERSLQNVIARKEALTANNFSLLNSMKIESNQIDEDDKGNWNWNWNSNGDFTTNTNTNFIPNLNGNGQVSTAGPTSGQLLMNHLDPWISPFNTRVRESIFQNILEQGDYDASRSNDAVLQYPFDQGNQARQDPEQSDVSVMYMDPVTPDFSMYIPSNVSNCSVPLPSSHEFQGSEILGFFQQPQPMIQTGNSLPSQIPCNNIFADLSYAPAPATKSGNEQPYFPQFTEFGDMEGGGGAQGIENTGEANFTKWDESFLYDNLFEK